MLKISVVIVTYNGKKYIKDCLKSLKKQTLPPFEIIVVDNNSSDNTSSFIKNNFDDVKVIENKKNVGFAKANNQGIELALKKDPDYIFLLNQDTVCDVNCLEELAYNAKENKDLVISQSLLMCHPKKEYIQTAGNKLHFLGFGYSSNYKIKKDEVNFKGTPSITYASGAAMFLKASFIKKYGSLDEKIFMYHEDTDISLRARMLGKDVRLVPKSIVYHKYTEKISNFRWYWSERNRLFMLLRFFKIPTLILLLPAFLFMELGILLYSIFGGWFFQKIKTYLSFIFHLPHVLKQRKKIQNIRKISDKELSQFLTSKFNFKGFTHPLIKYVVNPIFGFYWKNIKKLIKW